MAFHTVYYYILTLLFLNYFSIISSNNIPANTNTVVSRDKGQLNFDFFLEQQDEEDKNDQNVDHHESEEYHYDLEIDSNTESNKKTKEKWKLSWKFPFITKSKKNSTSEQKVNLPTTTEHPIQSSNNSSSFWTKLTNFTKRNQALVGSGIFIILVIIIFSCCCFAVKKHKHSRLKQLNATGIETMDNRNTGGISRSNSIIINQNPNSEQAQEHLTLLCPNPMDHQSILPTYSSVNSPLIGGHHDSPPPYSPSFTEEYIKRLSMISEQQRNSRNLDLDSISDTSADDQDQVQQQEHNNNNHNFS